MSKQKKKTTYRLYALRNNEENMKLASKHRYSRVTAGYVLIYEKDPGIIDDCVKSSYIIIREDDIARLTERDKEWLTSCNMTILFEEAAKNEDIVLNNINETLQKLEEALKAEADKAVTGED